MSKSILILALPLVTSLLPAQRAVHDLFNRANNGSLGPDWTEQDGDSRIQGNQLQANSPFSFGWASHNVFSSSYANTVVRAAWAMNGGGGDSVSLIAGVDPSSWAGIEARISDNNGDGFADRVFFNAAVNAGNWYGGPIFFNIATPLAAGTATLWFTNGGGTANLEIRGPGSVESFSAGGILAAPPTGTRAGAGYFGNGFIEDYRAWNGSPAGPVFTSSPLRANASAELLVTGALPFSTVFIGLSTAGAGPVPTPLGIVALSDPILVSPALAADAAGAVVLPLGTMPPAITGVVIHAQALDAGAPALTNYFTVTGL